MKTILFGALTSLLLISCNKECEFPTEVCEERPPTGQVCEAYFTSWFYNDDTNSCEQIGYSGCNAIGFQTKSECEACICNK